MSKQPRELWTLTDHICRACFGRVLRQPQGEGVRRYRCSNCGLEATGRDESALCACGLRLKGGRDAGIRCERNPTPTPEFPSEIVAGQT